MEQREVKFRAWGGKQMYFFDLKDLYNEGCEANLYKGDKQLSQNTQLPYDGMSIMQYTGLKDKNGKEIYEGDIVKCHDHPTGASDTIGEVYWKDGKWMVTWSMVDLGDYGTAWIEIVGNIHQNPELLTQ